MTIDSEYKDNLDKMTTEERAIKSANEARRQELLEQQALAFLPMKAALSTLVAAVASDILSASISSTSASIQIKGPYKPPYQDVTVFRVCPNSSSTQFPSRPFPGFDVAEEYIPSRMSQLELDAEPIENHYVLQSVDAFIEKLLRLTAKVGSC